MARTRRRTGKISLVARAEILVADDARGRIRSSPRDPGDPRYVSLADVFPRNCSRRPLPGRATRVAVEQDGRESTREIPRRVIRSHPSYTGCRSLSRAIASRPAIAMRSTLRFVFVPANERSWLRYYCSWRTRWNSFFFFFYYVVLFEKEFARASYLLPSLAFYFFTLSFFFFFFSRKYYVSCFLSSAENTPTNLQNFLQHRIFCYISPLDIFIRIR